MFRNMTEKRRGTPAGKLNKTNDFINNSVMEKATLNLYSVGDFIEIEHVPVPPQNIGTNVGRIVPKSIDHQRGVDQVKSPYDFTKDDTLKNS